MTALRLLDQRQSKQSQELIGGCVLQLRPLFRSHNLGSPTLSVQCLGPKVAPQGHFSAYEYPSAALVPLQTYVRSTNAYF